MKFTSLRLVCYKGTNIICDICIRLDVKLLNKRYIFAGPMFHPEMHGSLAFFRAILNGEKLKEIPNDSMSFIDVRDLAELELAALENKNARGKYYTKNRLHFHSS